MSDNPRVLALLGDIDSGPAWWRCQMPFSFLQRKGFNVAWADTRDEGVPWEMGLYDIFVMYRLYFPDLTSQRKWLGQAKRFGKLVIFDTDDDYLSHTDYIKPGWDDLHRKKIDEGREPFLRLARASDGITVSTPHLQGVMARHMNTPSAVIPNLLDLKWFDFALGKSKRLVPADKVSIAWAGGRRNERDLEEVAGAWTRIAADYPQAHFTVAGWASPTLLASVPEERLTVLPWTSYEVYPMHYGSFDIGCCPLAASAFNWSKSPIKAVEYGAARLPVVASPTVYGPTMISCRIARTEDEWYDNLAELVEDEQLRRDEGERLREEVTYRHSLQMNWLKIISGWQTIIDKANEIARTPKVLTLNDGPSIMSPVLP